MVDTLLENQPQIDKFVILLKPERTSSPINLELEKEGSPSLKTIGIMGTVRGGESLGYMLHCDFWGKGYMTEALKAFVGADGIFWRLPGT